MQTQQLPLQHGPVLSGRDSCQIRETLKRGFEERQVTIKVKLDPLESAVAFPYLGHTIAYNNSN